ncbi:MAG: M12 family metallopeptidase [Saprospiraceae bacterium]
MFYEKSSDKAFIHTVSSSNRSGHITTLDHPMLNNKPNAIVLVTQRSTSIQNNHEIGVWYSGGRWKIFNQDRAALTNGAKFNVLVASNGAGIEGASAFTHTHTVTSKIAEPNRGYTKLDNSSVNKNDKAKLFVTQCYTGTYNANTFNIWFDSPADGFKAYADNSWFVYNSQNQEMPINASFHVLALGGKSTNASIPHICMDWPNKPSPTKLKKPECVNCEVSATIQALVAETSKKWANGTSLRVKITGGTPIVRSKIDQYAKEWSNYANIKFNFVSSGDAEILITVGSDGKSYSKVGTDAVDFWFRAGGDLGIVPNETMHFGWFTDSTSEEEFRRVVLHEFGHALGFIHEHESPVSNIPWDKDAVYNAYMQPPNPWTKEEVDNNLFQKYSMSWTQFSNYDPTSIMHYPIDEALTIGNYAVGLNTMLSDADKNMARALYPPGIVTGNRVKISVLTGGDDLREKSQAYLHLKFAKGQPNEMQLSLNNGGGWGNNSWQIVEIPVPDGISVGDLKECKLKFVSGKQFPWDTPDNWNVDRVILEWITPENFSNIASDVRGTPLIRFYNTGETHIYQQ